MADITKRIIYPNDEGGVSIVVPSPNTSLSLAEIEARVVPTGKSRQTVDVTDIPTDRTYRDAWTYEES
jgi:hypothetical protein|tara:strand:- start:54 stop:257 length:204 start_codon:yes stop_codon:yes gene_type:complete